MSCGEVKGAVMHRSSYSYSAYAMSMAERLRPGATVIPLVLVVDDDPDIREALEEVLETEGYHVISAQHGAEALELLRKYRPDLVVLDLMMPVMDGATFIAAKRRDPAIAEIPVLVMTAAVQPQVEGAAMLMRKPFELDGFLRAVARCISEC